ARRQQRVQFVDDNAAAAHSRRRVRPVGGAHHVVVDDAVALVGVPDLDAEPIRPAAAGRLAVPRGQFEAVTAGAVDRARAAEPGFRAGHDQPFVTRALEVEAAHLELDLGVPGRYG